ncbi:MAG: hypothetical protein PHY08_05165 [Candidatus Cloacimonetes bacterium]|jgi:hypothetical protein|nr:hypothetical protein [Candidatus Cloacimonadota bacterium]
MDTFYFAVVLLSYIEVVVLINHRILIIDSMNKNKQGDERWKTY